MPPSNVGRLITMQQTKQSLRKRIHVGQTFHAPPWILDDAKVTEVSDDRTDVPNHIWLSTSTDAWTFRAVEQETDTEWFCVVAPKRAANHEAVVYLCFHDSDGNHAGHHEVYAKGIVTDD